MEISVGHQSSAILIALALIVLNIHLVRKRLLREEYSWLWLLTGLTYRAGFTVYRNPYGLSLCWFFCHLIYLLQIL